MRTPDSGAPAGADERADTLFGDPPATAEAAEALQERWAPLVRQEPLDLAGVSLVAGLDVAYSPGDDRLAAAAVVLAAPDWTVVETATAVSRPRFPYVPGLFAFREAPALLEAVAGLRAEPDVWVCDGFGLAHPRRFGLACHIGLALDRPVLGVGKTPFIGRAEPPAAARGSWSELVDGGEVVGRCLRTRDGVKPVYVSVGHRVDLASATELVLRLAPRYRLPEPVRQADRRCRERLAAA
ncbi:endonuclease V [Streptomonospora nanhaiensis]|uniref:Endonuclease V n=1 Tax=Streptomonospora nanhaiensis TaxID=1323731 RepID=A0A853BGY2_9ACTN|nr:endonuclease V [Streptomonospora nanhaiensis]MBX9389292.1 endonuclease V [Streptomonospora nanhaiensis]NYI94573.1 deoxyribonuclease V [Streptomonospora nanhaiensis]